MGKSKFYIGIVLLSSILFSCKNERLVSKKEMKEVVYELVPFKSEMDSLNEHTCFKLLITENNNSGVVRNYYLPSNYNKLLYFVNKELDNSLLIYSNGHEVKPAMVYFEPNMKMTNSFIVIVAFERLDLDSESLFCFNDNLFNNGRIKLGINNDFNI